MKVYALTTIDIRDNPVIGTRRTPAIFTSKDAALYAVKNNEHDIADRGLYQYAVVEETFLNYIRPETPNGPRYWFRYNPVHDEFESLDLPEVPPQLAHLYGFGIG
jgi:hypothetical protein